MPVAGKMNTDLMRTSGQQLAAQQQIILFAVQHDRFGQCFFAGRREPVFSGYELDDYREM